MKMALYVEASHPNGRVYRLGFGAFVPLELVSMILLFARLF